uniref:Lipase maturation factor n=1 Tax=Schistosoma haematobium TaxID=6185 RepID=A0A094ZYU1_SCHHA
MDRSSCADKSEIILGKRNENKVQVVSNEDKTTSGEIMFGGIDDRYYTGDLTYSDVVSEEYWMIKIDGFFSLHLENVESISINDKIFCPSGSTALIDTGTALISGPTEKINNINKYLGSIQVSNNEYIVDCNKIHKLPIIEIKINGKPIQLKADDYIVEKVSNGSRICRTCFIGTDFSSGPLWVFGDVLLRKVYTVFDVGQRRIGIADVAEECIPTPVAWYAHHLPGWIHSLCVAATFIIEIPLPLLFFVPFRTTRLVSFYSQVCHSIIRRILLLFQLANYWTMKKADAYEDLALNSHRFWRKLYELFGVIIIGFIGFAILMGSLVPFASLDSTIQLPPQIRQVYKHLQPYYITNSYGLFRRMTGVGGRPELILEAASSPAGPWYEYEFNFKPGRIDRTPPVVIPHQPRLDWQMWFAALTNYRNHPWLMNLVYRLLNQQTEVLELLDPSSVPNNPKYIRAHLYTYHFTDSFDSKDWWKRTFKSEYLPPVTLSSEIIRNAVEENGLVGKRRLRPHDPTIVSAFLTRLRSFIGQPRDLSPLIMVCLVLAITKYAFNRADQSARITNQNKA